MQAKEGTTAAAHKFPHAEMPRAKAMADTHMREMDARAEHLEMHSFGWV